MAWYRLYRPQQVQELALAPVREYFEGVLKSGRYAHAYLFAGPKGTGKTSTARILARILNEPANAKHVVKRTGPLKEPSSDDPILRKIATGQSQVVLEQDAASHRGIDDIRALQEYVSVVPSEGLVRVVILDEVHMLTTEAFNALLKMLEEPPERVVFVLATTEPHKIPATIQSRCEILRFRQATAEEITTVLQSIAKQEKIELSEQARGQLITAAQGSFRDAVKYFEAVVHGQAIDEDRLQQLAGSTDQGRQLLTLLAKKDLGAVSAFFITARQQGQNLAALEQTLFQQLQERLHRAIERQETKETIGHISQLLDHLAARVGGYEPIDGLKLELACISWCLEGGDEQLAASSGNGSAAAKPSKSSSSSVKKNDVKPEKPAIPLVKDEASVAASVQQVRQPGSSEHGAGSPQFSRQTIEQAWSNLLLSIRTESQALESLLRNAQLGAVNDNVIELQFELRFHQEQLEAPKYASLFRQALREKFQVPLDFRCTVLSLVEDETTAVADASDDQLLQAVEAAVLSLEDRSHSGDPLKVQ